MDDPLLLPLPPAGASRRAHPALPPSAGKEAHRPPHPGEEDEDEDETPIGDPDEDDWEGEDWDEDDDEPIQASASPVRRR